jgi:hypothetical protein
MENHKRSRENHTRATTAIANEVLERARVLSIHDLMMLREEGEGQEKGTC